MIFYHLIGLIISLSVLIWGADKFIDNSSLIAKKLGLSELTIGLTIVALGTSAPEIFVGISSVLNGTESIAMGAVVGSNISNIALIFGVSCIGISMQPAKTNSFQFIPFILAVVVLGLGLQDLKITKDGADYFPWVLNSTPNSSSLSLPATTGFDHLNNMEQVTIYNPLNDSYQIEVSGFNIPFGPAPFFDKSTALLVNFHNFNRKLLRY